MYSQNSEEEIIYEYYKGGKGVFADFGCNDGITFSNTYILCLEGWKGHMVEASPKAFDKLKKNYKRNIYSKLYNVAITADLEGEITFYESGKHITENDVSLLSTIHKSELKRWEGSANEFQEVKVTAIPFKKWYDLIGKPKLEFISLDIEGEDLNLLRVMDLKKIGCSMLCIEYNSDPQALQEIRDICASFGLTKQALINAENVIFCHE